MERGATRHRRATTPEEHKKESDLALSMDRAQSTSY
jgi:hypothetical protein